VNFAFYPILIIF